MADPKPTTSLKSGVYCITCIPTGKVYVGQAVDIKQRWAVHKCDLRRGSSNCKQLQRAWNKYGEHAFIHETLEFIDHIGLSKKELVGRLTEREQYYMDLLKASDGRFGFNGCPAAGSALGFRHSPETRAKVSAAMKARTLSAEHRAKLIEHCAKQSAAMKGKPHSAEHRAKISASMMGRPVTAKMRAKTIARNTGRVVSAETRAKQSAAMKGRTPSNKGRGASAETRAKLSAALKGRTLSAEHRAKVVVVLRKPRKPASGQLKLFKDI
jgi:group I intron endonuclease